MEWPSNITPLFLPPYSPELNEIERLWPQVRLCGLSDRSLSSGEALDRAGVEAWNRVTPEIIKSTGHAAWVIRKVNEKPYHWNLCQCTSAYRSQIRTSPSTPLISKERVQK